MVRLRPERTEKEVENGQIFDSSRASGKDEHLQRVAGELEMVRPGFAHFLAKTLENDERSNDSMAGSARFRDTSLATEKCSEKETTSEDSGHNVLGMEQPDMALAAHR